MLIAKIYKNTIWYAIPKLYRSTTKYEIPKNIKISMDIKKKNNKRYNIPKYTRIPDYMKDNIYKYQSITKI